MSTPGAELDFGFPSGACIESCCGDRVQEHLPGGVYSQETGSGQGSGLCEHLGPDRLALDDVICDHMVPHHTCNMDRPGWGYVCLRAFCFLQRE